MSWEYRKILVDTLSLRDEDLNDYGRRGWELVAATKESPQYTYLWFKREKPGERR